ncbi:MAG: dTDP-4-dehydrorhamnose reductase [Actinomycetales bacterium]|nr:dTDP-4-dehydrorhamnose reductase [Actinomycetales bacterium]
MRWMVTGAQGMLGKDLVPRLEAEGHDVVAVDVDELDITRPDAVAGVTDVDVLVNCAAYTAVDAAEENEGRAFAINAVGPQLLARAARACGARLVQISTDYVFAGNGTSPYAADEVIAPLSAYGRTKAAGEWAVRAETDDHLIIRTAWLYGAQGACFPKTMARLAAEKPRLQVVADQVGQPTWTVDLADLIVRLVAANAPSGTYHGTASGEVSWHGFTQEIVRTLGKDPAMVEPTTSEAFVRPAPRPAYSVLSHDSLRRVGVTPIGEWRERWQVAAPHVLSS